MGIANFIKHKLDEKQRDVLVLKIVNMMIDNGSTVSELDNFVDDVYKNNLRHHVEDLSLEQTNNNKKNTTSKKIVEAHTDIPPHIGIQDKRITDVVNCIVDKVNKKFSNSNNIPGSELSEFLEEIRVSPINSLYADIWPNIIDEFMMQIDKHINYKTAH